VENLDHSFLGGGLERALKAERVPSPTTPEPASLSGSEETAEQGRTRPNMMVVPAEQGGATSSETTLILNPEQMGQITASLSGGTLTPRVKEPEVYRGERH